MLVAAQPASPGPGRASTTTTTRPRPSRGEPAAAGRARRLQEGPARRGQAALDDPADQRPGVLIPYAADTADTADQCGAFFGANTLLDHGRCYYESGKPYLVPIEYRWKPQLVYAPEAFTTALFQQMMADSTTGDFTGTTYRPYLEAYNTTRGLFRGLGNQVAAGNSVRFFDAEKTETWLAQNSMSYLGFDPGPKGGTTSAPARSPATRSSS